MKKLIFIEQMQIGGLNFKGYIVAIDESQVAYSIFINDFDESLMDFICELDCRVCNLNFNPIMIEYLLDRKPSEKELRISQFQQVYDFILESERKASYMIFKNEKLDYIRKNKLIVQLRKLYIHS